ncbi:nitroreductase family protein [Bacteroidota bacterium]
MDIHTLIKNRWSPVAFSDQVIETDVIQSIFEAASWAPSAYNGQPWRFIWGMKGDESYTVLFDLLNEGNQVWAKTAPVLVLSIAETMFVDRGSKNKFAMHDTGMAVGNLLLQATHAGLFVHQMGGYDAEKAMEVFKLSEYQIPMAVMAIGYKGDKKQLPEEVAKREDKKRERKQVGEFVFNTSLSA